MNINNSAVNIICDIYDEKSFKEEVYDFLTQLIDEEVMKEDPDCDFIDDCVNTLESIIDGNYSTVVPFITKNKLAKGTYHHRAIGLIVAAAIILSVGISAVAINYNIEKKKAEETSGLVAVKTTAVTSTTTTTASTTTITISSTTTLTTENRVENLILKFGKNFKDEYIIGEKLSLDGVNVILQYTDGSEKPVGINSCKITTGKDFGKEEKYETITVSYNGKSSSFRIRVLRGEDTKVLNSIYASFPVGFDFMTDDINNIDLSAMSVWAVYSDEQKTKLKPDEYKIKKELLPDGKTTLITVIYKDCETSFGIKERPQGDEND